LKALQANASWNFAPTRLLTTFVVVGAVACAREGRPNYVRVTYVYAEGAPAAQSLRISWDGKELAWEDLRPGDDIYAMVTPEDGGGHMDVSYSLSGHTNWWSGKVGFPGDQSRYAVTITIDPVGSVSVKHCTHPCEASEWPWYEPWRSKWTSGVDPVLWTPRNAPNCARSVPWQRAAFVKLIKAWIAASP
jgi:hypothetical protein